MGYRNRRRQLKATILAGVFTRARIIRGCTTKSEQDYLIAGQAAENLLDNCKSANQKIVTTKID